jgi:NAD(P)-dependent dehydrogenase (short-subunit alcohol dehydrogenase family)
VIPVTGSTGNTGRAAVRALARHGQRVRAGPIGSADLGRNLRSRPSDDDARTEMSGRVPAKYVDVFFKFLAGDACRLV